LNPTPFKLTLSSILNLSIEKLQEFAENPRSEAEQIILHAFQIPNRTELYLQLQKDISQTDYEKVLNYLKRRLQGEPLQYVLGIAYFWNLPFVVNQDVLIPRPETELIVEYVKKYVSCSKRILDIGTGSGCISIALKKENPAWLIDAVDISEKALKIAKFNAKKNQVEIRFFQSNFFSKVEDKYDIIISNPPYISEKEFEKLPSEISEYEPKVALISGEKGIDSYQIILRNAPSFLNNNGVLLLEIGAEQAKIIKKLAKKNGFTEMHVKKDLNGFDRLIIMK
jgi:release factor glutamine methyltransferase